jgi:hypothetical protein
MRIVDRRYRMGYMFGRLLAGDYFTTIGLIPELPEKFAFGRVKSWTSYRHFDVPFQTANVSYLWHFERRSDRWAQNVKGPLFGAQFLKHDRFRMQLSP